MKNKGRARSGLWPPSRSLRLVLTPGRARALAPWWSCSLLSYKVPYFFTVALRPQSRVFISVINSLFFSLSHFFLSSTSCMLNTIDVLWLTVVPQLRPPARRVARPSSRRRKHEVCIPRSFCLCFFSYAVLLYAELRPSHVFTFWWNIPICFLKPIPLSPVIIYFRYL